MFDYLEINFHTLNIWEVRILKEMVATAEEHIWEFNVFSNLKGEATLGQPKFMKATKELYLLDIARQHFVNMREVNAYSFSPQASVSSPSIMVKMHLR